MHALTVLLAITAAAPPQSAPQESYVETMKRDAPRVLATVASPWVKEVLARVGALPPRESVVLYRDAQRDLWLDEARFLASSPEEQRRFTKEVWADDKYYAKWSTPLAWARPLDLAAQHGLAGLDGKKVVDFGYGDIGHLQLFARAGATAIGVDPFGAQPILYGRADDVGTHGRGTVALVHDRFPETASARAGVGTGVDVFLSKNTLKKGYVHPKKAVDPKKTLNLAVSDAVFLKSVHAALKPGGLVVIYNLAPAASKEGEPYKHWAEGESPFTREQWTAAGFELLAFDVDDSAGARAMAKALAWDTEEGMDLERDLFAWLTVARKR